MSKWRIDETIKVLGISGSARQRSCLSKSEKLLLKALDYARVSGAVTSFIRLQDLKIYDCEGNYSENPSFCTYPCQNTLKYEDDEMQKVYDAVLETDVLFLATPIRWNNHSALVQKFIERMNAIENSSVWFGKKLIKNKVVGLIIIGHQDGFQHVAGNLLNFFSWLGFTIPEIAITSWIEGYNENTVNDWKKLQNNKYTQKEIKEMVDSALRLAYKIK